MKKLLTLILGAALMTQAGAQTLTQDAIYQQMERVAYWQIAQKLNHHPADWTNAALYAGMMDWAQMAKDAKYLEWLKQVGKANKWAKHPRPVSYPSYHADDYAVGIMYLDMYKREKDEAMLRPMQEHLDRMMSRPSTRSMDHSNWRDESPSQRWTWCDALFMAPPVFAKMYSVTKDRSYLDFMHQEYQASADYLYDHKEHLFYRDSKYFYIREANGEKIFWGRGNGWVFAGLALIIPEMKDAYREKMWYEKLFTDMAERIITCQDENGYWHASMLDRETYSDPEMSSTGFFTYGLAWGINAGYLDKEKYLPIVQRAWAAMCKAVQEDGKVCWVQPIGAMPKHVTQDMTEVYGVGAFLKAGVELYKLAEKDE